MFTLMVYDVIHGVVDISTPWADIFVSIMLHMIVARKFGLLMTLPHPVQGITLYMSCFNVFQDGGSAPGHYPHKAQTKTNFYDVYTHGV